MNCIVFQIPRKLLYFSYWKQRWVWKQTKEGFSEPLVSVYILPPDGGKENCTHNTKLSLQFCAVLYGRVIACLLVVSFWWWSVQWICSGWSAFRRPGTGCLCLAPSATRGAQRWWCQNPAAALSLSLFPRLSFLRGWNHIPNLHNKPDQWLSTGQSWPKNRSVLIGSWTRKSNTKCKIINK